MPLVCTFPKPVINDRANLLKINGNRRFYLLKCYKVEVLKGREALGRYSFGLPDYNSNSILNSVPLFSRLLILIFPPSASTCVFTINNPTPFPSVLA